MSSAWSTRRLQVFMTAVHDRIKKNRGRISNAFMIVCESNIVKTLMTRLFAVLAAVTICCGLTTAMTLSTAQAAAVAPLSCPDPDCGGGGGDPGGPGDPGTPPPTTPAPTTCSNQGAPVYSGSATSYTPDCGTGYRVHAYTTLLRWDSYSAGSPVKSARMQSYIRFERNNGDGLDARNTRVACHDNYGGSGSDHEDSATKTTVTYSTPGIPPGAAVTVTCEQQATYNNITYSTTTVQTIYAPHPY